MAERLSRRLTSARRRRFVGRSAELELFRAALGRDPPEFAVLHIYGPGGIGKTSLLREFAHLVEESGRRYAWLDGRTLDPSPPGFLAAIHTALDLAPEQTPLEALVATPDLVVFIDTYELLAPLDAWLRDSFLPQLPAPGLVVIAGRQAPAAAWRADDGWGALCRIISLRNLRPDESTAYLQSQGLAPTLCARILDVTYGHPLALALTTDLLGQRSATTEKPPPNCSTCPSAPTATSSGELSSNSSPGSGSKSSTDLRDDWQKLSNTLAGTLTIHRAILRGQGIGPCPTHLATCTGTQRR